MSITIGRVENNFWTNSGYFYPNSIPIYSESKVLEDDEPNMIDFLSGTIYLKGKQWNHCHYKGEYFFLHIYKIIDEDKGLYLYRLERDIWLSVLKDRPTVIGNLVNSNNDELLEKNLNRTIAIIDNPSRVVTINFNESEKIDWRTSFTFKESKKQLNQIVLSRKTFDNLINSLNSSFALQWKTINQKFYSGNKNPTAYIINNLGKSIISNGWKDILRNKVNEFVENIPKDVGKNNLKIGKIEESAGRGIGSHYCITQVRDGISLTNEEFTARLKEIDLSGLEDIIPIEPETLTEIVPTTILYTSEGQKSGLFDNIDAQEKYPYPFLAKIRRKARTPINSDSENRPKDYESWGFSPSQYYSGEKIGKHWAKALGTQVVKWKHEGQEGTGWLWWVDNLNFIVEWDSEFDGGTTTQRYQLGTFISPIISNIGQVQEWRFRPNRNLFDQNNTFQEYPTPWTSEDPFPHVKSAVPFGVQIFGLYKRADYWGLFKYISNTPTKTIEYFSGISSEFLHRYRKNEGFWWCYLTENIKRIQPKDGTEFIKFYLDNFYFSWTALFPGSSKYYKNAQQTDIWGVWSYVNNNYYVSSITKTDIIDPKTGKIAVINPFNDSDERFTNYRRNLDLSLSKYFITSNINLPDNLTIEKDDYFFSSQEHSIEKCNLPSDNIDLLTYVLTQEEKTDVPFNVAKLLVGNWPSYEIYKLEDFANPSEYTNTVFNNENEKEIVVCAQPDGKIEIRFLYNFARTLSISDHPNQILETADNVKEKNTIFTILKKTKDTFVKYVGDKWVVDEEIKPSLIRAFYKFHGYKVSEGSQPLWTWFNKEDFSESNKRGLFFDLKGTKWWCYIKAGKISLIAKDETVFDSEKVKATTLKHNQKLNETITLLEKINQKVRFQFYGAPYYLNWKSSFSDSDRLVMSYQSITPKNKSTPFDEYFLKLETDFDQIHHENISIPKQLERAQDIPGIALQELHLKEARNQWTYSIEQERIQLATDKYHEAIRRSEASLEIQRNEATAELATTLGTLGFAGGVTALTGGIGAGTVSGAIGGLVKATAIIGATTKVGGAAKSHYFKHQRFAETQKRINMDRDFGARELALNSMVVDTTYIDRQISNQMQINKLFNTYSNPAINDRLVLDEYMKKTEWHDNKELSPAHLMIFIPSKEQLKVLKAYKDDFGIMCDIPNQSMPFFDGMNPDIVRFRRIEDSSLNNIKLEVVRRFFKARLLAGIKIIQTSAETYKLLSPQEYHDRILRLNSDLDTQAKNIKLQEQQIAVLENKYENAKQEARTELEQQIQNIENQLNSINKQLRDKVEELKNYKNTCDKEKKNLSDRVNNLETEQEKWREKENVLNDSIRRVADERDAQTIKLNNLKKEKEAEISRLMAQIQELNNRLEAIGGGQYSKVECDALQKALSDGYVIDPKPREDGSSKASDFMIALDQAFEFIRARGIDQALFKYDELSRFFEIYQELEDYPIVQAFDDLRRKTKNLGQIQHLLTSPNLQGVKAGFDELYYEAAMAYKNLFDNLDEDETLRVFFAHIFPGSSLVQLYRELFNEEASKTLARKTFVKTKCPTDEGIDAYAYLQDLLNTMEFDLSELAKYSQREPEIIQFKGVPLHDKIINHIHGYWNDLNVNKNDPGISIQRDFGEVQSVIYNWPYTGKEKFANNQFVGLYSNIPKNKQSETFVYIYVPTVDKYTTQFNGAILDSRIWQIYSHIKETQQDQQETDLINKFERDFKVTNMRTNFGAVDEEIAGKQIKRILNKINNNLLKRNFLIALFALSNVKIYMNSQIQGGYSHVWDVRNEPKFNEDLGTYVPKWKEFLTSKEKGILSYMSFRAVDVIAWAYKMAINRTNSVIPLYTYDPLMKLIGAVQNIIKTKMNLGNPINFS